MIAAKSEILRLGFSKSESRNGYVPKGRDRKRPKPSHTYSSRLAVVTKRQKIN